MTNDTGIIIDPEEDGLASGSTLEAETKLNDPDDSGHTDNQISLTVGGVNYTVTFGESDLQRLSAIIKPKPVPKGGDESQILADHRESVRNVITLICNMCMTGGEHHDERKLQQTPDQHHAEEVHHYPLDGFQIPDHFLPLTYVVEALGDYIATCFGRASANRGMDWISPTKSEQLTDVFNATALAFFQYYGLGHIEPPLPLEAQR